MADDDMFADLLGPRPPPEPVDPSTLPMRPKKPSSCPPGESTAAQSPPVAAPVPQGDLLQSGMYVMLKEDARDYIHDAVKASVDEAVQGSVGKLVQGVRDVLVSVTKRMECVEDEVAGLKETVAKADVESIQLQLNSRFSKVDELLKDLSRSIQAMRDHAELVDAQVQLSKLQTEGKKKKRATKTSDAEAPATSSEVVEAQRATSQPDAGQPAPATRQADAGPAAPAPSETSQPAPMQVPAAQSTVPSHAFAPSPAPIQTAHAAPTAPPATPTQQMIAQPATYQPVPQAPPAQPQSVQPHVQHMQLEAQPQLQQYSVPAPQPAAPTQPPQYSQQAPSYSQPMRAQFPSSYPSYSAPTAPSVPPMSPGGYMGYPQATAPAAPSSARGMSGAFGGSSDQRYVFVPRQAWTLPGWLSCLAWQFLWLTSSMPCMVVWNKASWCSPWADCASASHRAPGSSIDSEMLALPWLTSECCSMLPFDFTEITATAPFQAPGSFGGCDLRRQWFCSYRYGMPTPAVAPPPRPRSNSQGAQRSTQQVISDICAIGFERRRVEQVLQSMVQEGKQIDLNAVVDVLMSEQR
jgi:uncharacterized membrane-anchored protein YhcB (DUF1043 family)